MFRVPFNLTLLVQCSSDDGDEGSDDERTSGVPMSTRKGPTMPTRADLVQAATLSRRVRADLLMYIYRHV